MKNFLFLFSILFLSSFIKKDADKSKQIPSNIPIIYIDNIKNNRLYLGVENPIRLHVYNNIEKVIDVSTDNGKITSFGNRQYMIVPEKQGLATITVSLDGNKTIPIQFRVKLIPDPVARVCNAISGSEITQKDISTSVGIQILLMDFDFEVQYETVSYKLIKINANGTKTAIENTGAVFNDQIRNELKKSVTGDVLVFDQIKVKNNFDNFTRKIPAITYFIQ